MKDFFTFLLWCLLFNYLILIIWFVAFVFAHDFLHKLHLRWFKIDVEKFDTVHYGGMAVYKIGILIFNLAPMVALYLTNR